MYVYIAHSQSILSHSVCEIIMFQPEGKINLHHFKFTLFFFRKRTLFKVNKTTTVLHPISPRMCQNSSLILLNKRSEDWKLSALWYFEISERSYSTELNPIHIRHLHLIPFLDSYLCLWVYFSHRCLSLAFLLLSSSALIWLQQILHLAFKLLGCGSIIVISHWCSCSF